MTQVLPTTRWRCIYVAPSNCTIVLGILAVSVGGDFNVIKKSIVEKNAVFRAVSERYIYVYLSI